MLIKNASVLIFVALFSSAIAQVTFEECKAGLPDYLACLDGGVEDCGVLPVPDFAFPQDEANEHGYALKHLRHSPNTHIFAIGDFALWAAIIVDVSPAAETSVGRTVPDARKTLRGRRLQGDPDMDGPPFAPVETSNEDIEPRLANPSITVRLIDFPESFLHFGADGSIEGHHHLCAVNDILDFLNATMSDVAAIEMMYSHGHMDHIGAADWVHEAIMDLGFDDVPIIASEGTKHFLEELERSGRYSRRAPIPTEVFSGKQNLTVGASTTVSAETVSAHMHDARDVLLFFEEVDGQPAIMVMIDIVFPKWSPFYSFALTTDLLGYVAIHDKMLYEYDLGEDGYLIGGHLTQLGNRMDIEINKNMTESVIANAKNALVETDFGAEAFTTGAFTPGNPNFGNSWYGFHVAFETIIEKCARATIEQFGCVLASIDVMARSHCDMAQSFVRIDS